MKLKDRMEVIQGDITRLKVDAIVNAANPSLMGGGGVDGAIHRAGGPQILEECKEIIKKIGRLDTGKAVITTGGNLPASYVIHTVGPVWHGGTQGEAQLLAQAYTNSLQLASEHHLRTVAFPNISTGVYGYPKREAAQVALQAVTDYLRQHTLPEKVIFCCFDDENYRLYQEAVQALEE
ncbi:O-acetyl-ADP-ribose deacetylase [Thermonema rossianum]|jgi:O-acetyl-ADP-ribose deacetylase (regulator of RNase III)|uniref:O-acetyl-ADP-ribose deacetylase n=1 Tax=Thermonema rossianum TaxID=55505 RepID=UPI00056FAC8A|nr:O-acetyl-ADP-ribose deacetylase [Thermonema rossianum]